jgi:predicted NUDIX family NTP pyrophosphohydrolase
LNEAVQHGQNEMSESRSKVSSGTLLYRFVDGAMEVLLVHPAGNYNRRAPWGIPKGAPDPDEELEATARRETLEETGLAVIDTLVHLGFVDYTRSKKRVHAYAGPAPDGAAPRCASWEVDKVEFIEITRARRIIHPDQAALLDRLQRHLDSAVETVDEKSEIAKTPA